MINDDEPVGRVLSRREVIKLLGASGLALVVGCGPNDSVTEQVTSVPTQAAATHTAAPAVATSAVEATNVAAATAVTPQTVALPSCIVRPALTEGPYFVDERLNRSDIRSDPSDGSVREGAPLRLVFNVSRIDSNGCNVFPDAYVDVWHCDGQGVYSDATDRSFNTVGQKFLRGYQVTDANGRAEFLTIYPGWYNGRTVHIHFKIRTALDAAGQEFTSQLFFDDAYTDVVYQQEPYASTGTRTVRNNDESIYRASGGQLDLVVTEDGDGYVATFDSGLDMS
jgi:protocatechuate 3,4-dioxygenase beta subunit